MDRHLPVVAIDDSLLCDGCGKSVEGDYYTDEEVCRTGDGPGFVICGEPECTSRFEASSREERKAHYTEQRTRNYALQQAQADCGT